MKTTLTAALPFILSAVTALAQPTPKGGLAPVKPPDSPLSIGLTKTLSTQGSTRGTAYVMSNKVVTMGSRTHVTWLDSGSKTMVQTYDHARKEWLAPVHVGTGYDNHGGPALVADSKGYLHIIFGPHHHPFQYRRSERPNDSSAWTPVERFATKGTYPSLVCDGRDTFHLAYRGGDAPFKLLYQRKPRGGDWTVPRVLVDADVPGGYTQFGNCLYVGRDGVLHLAFHIYDLHPARGKSAGYMRSPDGGDTWTTADGAALDLPVKPDSPAIIERGDGLDMRVGNVACDGDGRPYFTVAHGETDPSHCTLWHFDGARWRSQPLAPVVESLYPGANLGAGTLTFDDEGNLYIAMSISRDGKWGDPTSEVILLYSEDRGRTFSVLPISPVDATVANWLPALEHFVGHNRVGVPWLLYTHGVPGEGVTPPDLTEIRAVMLQR